MKVLILGKGGQLSTELLRTRPSQIELHQWGMDDWNFLEPNRVEGLLEHLAPDAVINAAAYTAVDQAEKEEGLAEAINAVSVGALARACASCESSLIHISTDFVFDGESSSPYGPEDITNPLGVYGKTKRQGEEEVLEHLPDTGYVVRTSWLYSSHGKNFVKTMLRLMDEKDSLGVVSDQYGCPTWAKGLAETLWAMTSSNGKGGLYHWCDQGVISWYDFAVAIQQEALQMGLLNKNIPIKAISTEAYPTPARRPAFSALECSKTVSVSGIAQREWRESLRAMLQELEENKN